MDAHGILFHERVQNIFIALSNYKKQEDNVDNGNPIPTASIHNQYKQIILHAAVALITVMENAKNKIGEG